MGFHLAGRRTFRAFATWNRLLEKLIVAYLTSFPSFMEPGVHNCVHTSHPEPDVTSPHQLTLFHLRSTYRCVGHSHGEAIAFCNAVFVLCRRFASPEQAGFLSARDFLFNGVCVCSQFSPVPLVRGGQSVCLSVAVWVALGSRSRERSGMCL
jgi:hypothetical protein